MVLPKTIFKKKYKKKLPQELCTHQKKISPKSCFHKKKYIFIKNNGFPENHVFIINPAYRRAELVKTMWLLKYSFSYKKKYIYFPTNNSVNRKTFILFKMVQNYLSSQCLKQTLVMFLVKFTQKMQTLPFLRNKVREARSIWWHILKIAWNWDFQINTKFVLGLNRAKQLGLEHWE